MAEGITSLLDTDLYKLTMQCCILTFFPQVPVTYSFTNRTPDKKLNRTAFAWLQAQVDSKPSRAFLVRQLTSRTRAGKSHRLRRRARLPQDNLHLPHPAVPRLSIHVSPETLDAAEVDV